MEGLEDCNSPEAIDARGLVWHHRQAERTTKPDTSGNSCAKLDPRYLTQLSAHVLMFTVPISVWARSLCSEWVLKIDSRSIAWLPMVRNFANQRWVYLTRNRSRFQLAYPTPDPDFPCLFHPNHSHSFAANSVKIEMFQGLSKGENLEPGVTDGNRILHVTVCCSFYPSCIDIKKMCITNETRGFSLV